MRLACKCSASVDPVPWSIQSVMILGLTTASQLVLGGITVQQ